MTTYVCIVEAKKAFDTVQKDCLWYKLISLGIKRRILYAIQSLCTGDKGVVKVNGYLTPSISLPQGV